MIPYSTGEGYKSMTKLIRCGTVHRLSEIVGISNLSRCDSVRSWSGIQ
jgi:hypothetical protein